MVLETAPSPASQTLGTSFSGSAVKRGLSYFLINSVADYDGSNATSRETGTDWSEAKRIFMECF